jgi:hypothetical protein
MIPMSAGLIGAADAAGCGALVPSFCVVIRWLGFMLAIFLPLIR